MIILGIDPGLTQTGYGLINASMRQPFLIDYGVIKPPGVDHDLSDRLLVINSDIFKIIEEYKPSVLVVEDIFYGKNVKSTILLSHARSAVLLAGAQSKMPIYEYSARKIKQSLTGNGNAHKDQVKFMVTNLLKLKEPPKSNDASDALAIAICYMLQNRLGEL